ncbi:hypothetical protein [uncultured Shewanella sp.]|uniref:hypothetical protein n=1 Tax=uncultured Shewanella sp. TaxID=173975 RepID=UPI0026068B73|nr:hypothetical protein [uncultured Shewanella sp.]
MKAGIFTFLLLSISLLLFLQQANAKQVIKLTPQVRIIPNEIPTSTFSDLELALIRPYLSQNLIVSSDWLGAQFLVIGSDEPSMLYRESNTIYVNGVLPKGALLGVYQQGRQFESSHSGQIEQEMILVASVVVSDSGFISAVKVLSSFREIQLGDVVAVQSQGMIMPSYYIPNISQLNMPASIIASEAQRTAMGVMDVVYLNQGRFQGVREGLLLSISGENESVILLEKDQVVRLNEGTAYDKMMASYHWDPAFVMPRVHSGRLMIFKVFDNMSFGIIMENLRPIRVGDSVGGR